MTPLRPHSRLDVKSGFHRKVLHVGNAAWGAFQRLVAISNDYGTDGWVDSTTVATVCSASELETLVTSFPWAEKNNSLLEKSGTGFMIHDFGDWNDSAAKVLARKEQKAKAGKANAKRMASVRNAQGTHTNDTLDNTTTTQHEHTGVGVKISSLISEGESERGQTWDAKVAHEFTVGITEGLGVPYSWPTDLASQGALNQAIAAHALSSRPDRLGQKLRGTDLLGWVRSAAADYGAWLRAHQPDAHYWGHGSPKLFGRWLTKMAMGEEARRVG